MLPLLHTINVFLLITIKTVSTGTCPFCVNVKTECDKTENVLNMDCQTLKIGNQLAVSLVKQPSFLNRSFVTAEFLQKYKDLFSVGCLATNFQFELRKDLTGNNTKPNSFEAQINTNQKYTFKTCLVRSKLEEEEACDRLEEEPDYLANVIPEIEHFRYKIDDCTFDEVTTTSKSLPSIAGFSTRVAVFIMAIFLFKILNTCQ